MASLCPPLKTQFWMADASGAEIPVAAGKVYTYTAGTTNNKTTYTEPTETTENANPITLDAEGCCNLFLASGAYDIVVKDSDGTTLDTFEDVYANGAGGTTTALWSKTPKEYHVCIYENVSGSYKATNSYTEWSTTFSLTSSGELLKLQTDGDSTFQIIGGNDAGDDCGVKVEVGGASAGDAFVWFGITGTGNKWFVGMDNSDSDLFYLAYGSDAADFATGWALKVSTSRDATFYRNVIVPCLSLTNITSTANGYTSDTLARAAQLTITNYSVLKVTPTANSYYAVTGQADGQILQIVNKAAATYWAWLDADLSSGSGIIGAGKAATYRWDNTDTKWYSFYNATPGS